MAEPQDMILPLLREMRTELQTGFSDVCRQFVAVDARSAGWSASATIYVKP
jgi:hypothetical protein